MKLRAYKSNLSAPWTERRQDEALARAIPGYPRDVDMVSDWPDGGERQGHKPLLPNRDTLLLRGASRRAEEAIYMASLSVLAQSWEDGVTGEWGVARCLALAADRGATIHVVGSEPPLVIPPSGDAALFAQAAQEFAQGKRRQRAEKRGQVGGRVSAERRRAEAREKLKTIERFWHDPKETRKDAELAAIAGVSVNTVKEHLGDRPRKAIKRAREAADKAKRATKEQSE